MNATKIKHAREHYDSLSASKKTHQTEKYLFVTLGIAEYLLLENARLEGKVRGLAALLYEQ